MDPLTQLEIESSHGQLIVERSTGLVIPAQSRYDDDTLRQIHRFDLNEWRVHYDRPTPDCGDILDFGYWMMDGSYEEPAHDWRKDYGGPGGIADTHGVIR